MVNIIRAVICLIGAIVSFLSDEIPNNTVIGILLIMICLMFLHFSHQEKVINDLKSDVIRHIKNNIKK